MRAVQYTLPLVEGCKLLFEKNFPEESFSRFFRGGHVEDKIYKNVNRNRSGGLFGFAFREDDLIHKEEDHHGDTAVEDGGADAVDEVRHQQPGNGNPHAVDGVDKCR